ncbi:hypothetical protein [Psychromonas ossibalaenae]|uniref:hypothetical protein n=1 Tax=Psychromonas ossibalaenae TaxID=444922 RepID=UPI00037EB703|nr:hypothetical protein [Psychromonas ossibalaenae]
MRKYVVCLTLMLFSWSGFSQTGSLEAAAEPKVSSAQIEDWDSNISQPLPAAARYAGLYAVAGSQDASLELYDIDKNLLHSLDTEAFKKALSEQNLTESTASLAIRGVTFSASGRQLYIAVTSGPETLLQVFKLNTGLSQLSLFIEAVEMPQLQSDKKLAMAHHKGELWLGTHHGELLRYQAQKNDAQGLLLTRHSLAAGEESTVTGITIDGGSEQIYVSSSSAVYRLQNSHSSLTEIAAVPEIIDLSFARTYGAQEHEGLYILSEQQDKPNQLAFISRTALAQNADMPVTPYTELQNVQAIAATADGKMMLAAEKAQLMSDTADLRLSYQDWLFDEFQQYHTFIRTLLWPDGRTEGWVTGTEAKPGMNRYDIANSGPAGWAVLALIAYESMFEESGQSKVRSILTRHAGLSSDGIVPEITTDGLYYSNYEEDTGEGIARGGEKLSAIYPSAKLVHAALRAKDFYPHDAAIVTAADTIISRQKNYADYLRDYGKVVHLGTDYGPTSDTAIRFVKPYQESYIFAELAPAVDPMAELAYLDWWKYRENHAYLTTYLNDEPVIKWDIASFVEQYGHILFKDQRNDPAWTENFNNLYAHYAAWTDDNSPDYLTVFSAGATKSAGYSADRINRHPDTISHFPGLLGFGLYGDSVPMVGGYFAYRDGVRQKMKGTPGVLAPDGTIGADLLTRYSNEDPEWQLPRLGLADMIFGFFGLAEQLRGNDGTIGVVDQVIARNNHPQDFALEAQSGSQIFDFEQEGELVAIKNASFDDRLDYWTTTGDFNYYSGDKEDVAIDGRTAEIRSHKELTSEYGRLMQTVDLSGHPSMTPYVFRAKSRIKNPDSPDQAYLKIVWDNDADPTNASPFEAQYSNILDAEAYPYPGADTADLELHLLTHKPAGATHAHVGFEVKRDLNVKASFKRYLVDQLSMTRLSQELKPGTENWELLNGNNAYAQITPESFNFTTPSGTRNNDYAEIYRDYPLDSEDPLGTRYVAAAEMASQNISDSELRVYVQYRSSSDPEYFREEGADVVSRDVNGINIFHSSRRLETHEDSLRVVFRFMRKGSTADSTEQAQVRAVSVVKQAP